MLQPPLTIWTERVGSSRDGKQRKTVFLSIVAWEKVGVGKASQSGETDLGIWDWIEGSHRRDIAHW